MVALKRLKFGIIGPGRIAEKFAGTFTAGLVQGAELVAVASNTPGKASTFAQRFDIPRSYDSYNDMLMDADIDVVYISNINSQHFACCMACFAAGKHVLCEKPMGLRVEELEAVASAAARQGVFCMEAMWTRFTPVFDTIAGWLQSGRIGKLCSISATLCMVRHPAEFPRLFDPAQDGGALYDLGIYGIQTVQHFAKGAALQQINQMTVAATTGVDEATYLHLGYSNGLVGEIKCSIGCYACNEALLCGDKGYIRITPFFNFAQQAELFCPPLPVAADITPATPVETFTKTSTSGFEYEINHLIDCVGAGLLQSPIMPLADSIQIAEIFETVKATKPINGRETV